MRLKFSPKQIPVITNSIRTVRSGYYLIDDITHAMIQKTGDKIEQHTKTANGRSIVNKEIISGNLTRLSPPSIITIALIYGKPEITPLLATIAAFCYVSFSFAIRRSLEHMNRNDGTESMANYWLKIARLPMFALGLTALCLGWRYRDAFNIGEGVYFTANGIAFYLSSSSNGMLDRVTEMVKTSSTEPASS